MVRYVADRWNTLYPSLLLMHQKLEALGFVYVNGDVLYVEAGGSDV